MGKIKLKIILPNYIEIIRQLYIKKKLVIL